MHPCIRAFRSLSALVVAGVVPAFAAVLISSAAAAEPAQDFYRGRTITIIVGATESGAFSIYARALAEAMPRYLPGAPKIIVQAMPGAGGTVMANHMYNVAPKDGLTIGTPMVTMPLTQLQRPEAVRYDSQQFQWIGNLDGSPVVTLVVWHESPFKTFEDVKSKPLIVASSGKGSVTYQMPSMINHYYGTKIKIVTGYRGQADIDIAMMRREVHGRSSFYSSFLSSRPHEMASGQFRVVAQISTEVPAALRDVTNLVDVAPTAKARHVFEFFALQGSVTTRAFLAPPGVPPDRVAALRRAFDQVTADPEFVAMMKKRNLTLQPMSGENVQKNMARLMATPKSIVDELQDAIQ
jgi:tripartite-type tricarboxylate transporter receptor subunit TctC